MSFADPYFAITIPFDVGKAYAQAKAAEVSFFVKYLHDCMRAINAHENFKYRILDGQVVEYDRIDASTTIMREDKTFAFSRVTFNQDLSVFASNYAAEKLRIQHSTELFPPVDSLDCIHCSVLPWFNFSGHKDASSGRVDSVPKLAFGKTYSQGDRLMMNVAISVNHALMDGYHVSLFAESFQHNLAEDL
ncbi:MAG: CatA-like O-acetyltransferase [Xanthomonadales bacterium]|nr:CatA-like O-acetyltransferase [Xanthomonadales bacterium]